MVIVLYASEEKTEDSVELVVNGKRVYVRAAESIGNAMYALDVAKPREGEIVLNAIEIEGAARCR